MSSDDEVEEQEQEPEKHNNFAEVNTKRNVNKKSNAIRFFTTFTENKDKSYEEIAKKVGITKEVARKYLNELVGVVISCINNDTYPVEVLRYYNDLSIPPQQRLNAGHMQELKSILLKYNDVNIDSLLSEKEDDDTDDIPEHVTKSFENDLVLDVVNEEVEDDDNIRTPFKKFNEFRESQKNINPRTLNENSPIADVIEFGINNSGQPDVSKIKRIKTLFLSSPNFYLADEARFVELLESNEIKPKSLSTFMNWFKNIAPIKPSERVGFLNLQKVQSQNQGQRFNNFNITDYDDFAQFLYHEGVYTYGLPPSHHINQQAYKRYQEDKRLEEEERKMTRQFNMGMKKQMLEMSLGRGMMQQGQGQGGQQQGGIAFDERFLIERGIVTPEISYDENGRKSVRLIPTGKSLYDGVSQQQPPRDNFTESLNTFARVVDAVRPMMMTNQGTGTQSPMLDKILTVMLERVLNKAEENPTKSLHDQMTVFNQMKSLFPQPENKSLSAEDIRLQIELAKVHNDKEFSLKEIEIKEKMHEMEMKKMEEQKHDSKDNITMIMDWVSNAFKFIEPLIGKLLLGQFGGGLSSMIPGAGGGMGMEGMFGGMMGGGEQPQQTSMNDFMIPPQQPQQQTYQDFPQQPDFSYQPQPQEYQQPQPQQFIPPQQEYQPQPQQFVPPPPPPPDENEFLSNLSEEDLDTLSVNELNDIENRFETKAGKMERVLNLIKSTKAKKQFGYPQTKKYTALDIPAEMDKSYDGMDDESTPQQQPTMDELPPLE